MKILRLLFLLVLDTSVSFQVQQVISRGLSRTNGKSSNSNDKEGEVVVIQKLVEAVEQGREADLIQAGLKVTKLAKNPKESLNLLINDPQIREKVLGSTLSREEEEVIQAIHDASRDSDDITNSVDSSLTNAIISELNVDSGFILEKEREAKMLMNKMIGDDKSVLDSQVDDHRSVGTEKDLDKTFRQLLKTSIDLSTADTGVVEENIVKGTVNSVSSGDFLGLDVRSIVGDALLSLSEELGIDMQDEIATDENTSSQLQEIIASSMEELAQSMEDLDDESAQLYTKLGILETELKKETEEFEEEKKIELNELLSLQRKFKEDFDKSQVMVQNSAFDMKKILQGYEESGDFITALALFPFKSLDKKVCFVLGLALLFKIPFDLSYYFSIREIDTESMIALLGQGSICALLFNHYGISISALLSSKDVDSIMKT